MPITRKNIVIQYNFSDVFFLGDQAREEKEKLSILERTWKPYIFYILRLENRGKFAI